MTASIQCRYDVAEILQRSFPKNTRCRMEWAAGKFTGETEWHPVSELKNLQALAASENAGCGEFSHWVIVE